MPAVLVDVGHHMVEPNMSGQTVTLSVVSTDARDPAVTSFDLRAQIVTAKRGPYFEDVRFAGDLWNSLPHVESGSPFPTNRTLATGYVAFTQGFEARADGTLVTLTIDTTGIPAGSYEFRLVGTQLGSSTFRRTDGSSVSEIITNGTLQVRSIWQNPDNPNDINGDGRLSPLDVLLLLNELSKKGSHEFPMPSPGEEPPPHFDVNGDGYLSPLDPLGAVNCLNGLSCISTPKPILAQVTPDFMPDVTDSAGVSEPVPDDSKPGDSPRDEVVNPKEPSGCIYYVVDEAGEPYPVIDSVFCDGTLEIIPDPILVEPVTPADILPSTSVDATIAELADELSDEEENALFALVLGDLLALGL